MQKAPQTQPNPQAPNPRAERAHRRLLKAAAKDGDTLLIQYDNSLAGYDEDDVAERRDEYGVNRITRRENDTLLKKIVGAFINPFTVVLIVLAVVSLFTDVIFVEPGQAPDVTAVVIIVVMVLVSGFLRFIQEMRSNNAAKRLTEMVKTTVYAQRKFHGAELNETHSEKVEIPLDEIVVGDLVYLAAGDMIPADVQTQ
jgi:Mg2+-importing ATPase